MDLGLAGRRILLCGASAGMGLATAQLLALEGAHLGLVARRPGPLEAVAAKLGGGTWAHPADLANEVAVHGLVAEVGRRWDRLDGLLLNTGGPPTGPLLEFNDDAWQQATATMLMSAVRLLRELHPLLRSSGSASVVAIESFTILEPLPFYVLSNSVRAAVANLLRTAATELGKEGIRFNTVCPGWTMTERSRQLMQARAARSGRTPEEEAAAVAGSIPVGRLAEPEEVGRVIAFLLSPAASYVNGVRLAVDGGAVRGV